MPGSKPAGRKGREGAAKPGTSDIARHSRALLDFLSSRAADISPLLILAHDFPDPDAMAGAYALKFLAEKVYGIRAKIVYGGIIGRTENRTMVDILKIPVNPLKPSDLKRYKSVALVDTQPAFGNNPFPRERRATLVIDQHHSVVEPNAELSLVDTASGATSVLLAKALLSLDVEIPRRVATALAYGILADTGNLSRSVHAEILDVYFAILALADVQDLARIQNPPRSRDFFTSVGCSIRDSTFHRGVVASRMREVETPDSVAQLADFLLSYEKAEWTFSLGRYRGMLHASLRSARPGVGAGEILRDIFPDRSQAGGHDMIAGGRLEVGRRTAEREWARLERELLRRLYRRLGLPAPRKTERPFRPR